MYLINLMIIYDVVNIFSMKTYKSSRKLRVGLNWYPGVNWSTTTTVYQKQLATGQKLGLQLVKVLYCKLPTNGEQLQAFPLEAMPGTEPRPQRWEVLPLCHRGPTHKVCENRSQPIFIWLNPKQKMAVTHTRYFASWENLHKLLVCLKSSEKFIFLFNIVSTKVFLLVFF